MNNPVNWDPNTVPGSADTAVFDSTIPGIDTNPTATSTPFSVSAFNFLQMASPFTFTFNNATLSFNGEGIVGYNTNCAIRIINTGNSSFAGNLISFAGGTAASGSSDITSANSAALSGNQSGAALGLINSNFYSNGAFTISSNGKITASNTGNDSANGTGSNGVANTDSSQLRFDQSFTAGNNAAISISNSGTFSGANSSQGDSVSVIGGSQFVSSGAFEVGDYFNCKVQNTGTDTSSGIGLNTISQINAAQMLLQSTGTVGNNCTITVTNTGINSSQTSEYAGYIGYLNDQQFFVGSTFQAGDAFTLTVNNIGADASSGYGNAQVAMINSNSGSTGTQVLFQQGCTLGSHATIIATNTGSYSGANTNGGPVVGSMNLQQIAIGDSTAPGSYTFSAGDYFSLSLSNSGDDSGHGTGSDAVGNVSADQITFYTPCSLGNNAAINLANSGSFSGQASSSYLTVGSAGGGQLNCLSSFQTGDNFTLNASNSGTHAGSGNGYDYIGDLVNGQQASFQNGLIIGNNASITLSNSGSNSSNTLIQNQIGSFMGYGKQLFVKEQFQTGDNLLLEVTNTGFDNSTGTGGNYVGYINNNTADSTASQIHLNAGGNVGNRASISLSNRGTYQGNNTGNNAVGVLFGQQFNSVADFHAEDNFSLTASNLGEDNASGQNNNNIGLTGSSGKAQVEFGGACILGNNASFGLMNSGVNRDVTGNSNTIGYIGGPQLHVSGGFTAGTNLNIRTSNSSINAGDSSNIVGKVNGSQLFFAQSCTLNDGSSISAFNSGTVTGSQIVFSQGFDIASGKVSIQAVNAGTVGSFGIDIQGSNAGGNANIILGNSSLYIETTLPTFTIAGLSGDSTSFVQSQPTLIINTDALTQTDFSGAINNFPATLSDLIKTGPGTQTLSGENTYTGLTTVQDGVLVVNGSLAGEVIISPPGTLISTGTIGGTITNTGIITPGGSIGTLTAGNYVNNGGTYALEVDGLGQSDRIDVIGTATLNGGTVIVSSMDDTFRFQQPYTILTAEGGITGTYTEATSSVFITPILTYDHSHVYLTVQPALFKAAASCNQYGVAKNLDGMITPNAEQSLLLSAIASLPLEKAQEALESLSGFQYANDVWVAELSTRRLLRRLYNPLRSLAGACGCCSPCDVSCSDWSTWLETGDSYTKMHGKKAHKLDINSYEATGGIQKSISCYDLTVGLAGSYEYDQVKYCHGKAKRHTEFLIAYGLYRPCFYYGLFDFVYGHTSNRLKRKIHAANLHYKAHSKPNLNTAAFYGEAGIDFKSACFLIQPFLGFQIGTNWRSHIKEHKANGWALEIKKHDWTSASSRLGLHLSTCDFCDGVQAALDIAWNQRWSGQMNSAKGRFKDFGDAFRICGKGLDNYSIDYALSLVTWLYQGIQGYMELDGEWWQHADTFGILGGIECYW